MTVSICSSDNGTAVGECGSCECEIGDCTQYEYRVWMYFNCDNLSGMYIRLSNVDDKYYLALSEVEAFRGKA